jgi:hypothetical protein
MQGWDDLRSPSVACGSGCLVHWVFPETGFHVLLLRSILQAHHKHIHLCHGVGRLPHVHHIMCAQGIYTLG